MTQCSIKSRFLEMAGCALCLAAMLSSVGGHWAVLQSIAWVCMIGDFSRQDSLRGALSKTFDGEHPCELCLGIEQGQSREEG